MNNKILRIERLLLHIQYIKNEIQKLNFELVVTKQNIKLKKVQLRLAEKRLKEITEKQK